MAHPSVNEYRKRRFIELLEHPDFGGSQAELGRALGWKSGAHVWQIVNNRRPVSEDLVLHIEGIRGGRYAGWFSGEPQPQAVDRESPPMKSTNAQWPLGDLITPERWHSLDSRTQAAAIAAAEAAIMESLIGAVASPGKRQGNGAQ